MPLERDFVVWVPFFLFNIRQKGLHFPYWQIVEWVGELNVTFFIWSVQNLRVPKIWPCLRVGLNTDDVGVRVLCIHQSCNLLGVRSSGQEGRGPAVELVPRILCTGCQPPNTAQRGGGLAGKSLSTRLVYVAWLTTYDIFLERRSIIWIRSSLLIECWG